MLSNERVHEILVLIAYAIREGSGETVHLPLLLAHNTHTVGT